MITPKHAAEKVAPVLSLAAVMLCASTALAQSATQTCRPAAGYPAHRHGARGKARHRCPAGRNHSPPAEWW